MPAVRPIAVALALTSGLVVLLDRLVSHPLLEQAAAILVDWAVLLAAVALLLGLANLAVRHTRTVGALYGRTSAARSQAKAGSARQAGLSLALLAALGVTLAAGLLDRRGTESPLSAWLFHNMQAPLQATLFSLLAFYMASAAYRVLRPRGSMGRAGLVFLVAAVVTIVAQLSGRQSSGLEAARIWLLSVPTLAAVRGLLLGIALGATLTGLRVILGLSRPYLAAEGRGDQAASERVEP